jgi:hypothetical protein
MRNKEKLKVVRDVISFRQNSILDDINRLEELKNDIDVMHDNEFINVQEYKRLKKLAKHVSIALYGRSVEVERITKEINKWVSIKKKKQRS